MFFIKFNQVAIYQNSDNSLHRKCTSYGCAHYYNNFLSKNEKMARLYSLVKFPILLKKLNLSKKKIFVEKRKNHNNHNFIIIIIIELNRVFVLR